MLCLLLKCHLETEVGAKVNAAHWGTVRGFLLALLMFSLSDFCIMYDMHLGINLTLYALGCSVLTYCSRAPTKTKLYNASE